MVMKGKNEMITVGLVWLGLSIVCGLAFGKMCKLSMPAKLVDLGILNDDE